VEENDYILIENVNNLWFAFALRCEICSWAVGDAIRFGFRQVIGLAIAFPDSDALRKVFQLNFVQTEKKIATLRTSYVNPIKNPKKRYGKELNDKKMEITPN